MSELFATVDDAALVHASRRGEPRAFEGLVRRHEARVRAVARRLVGDADTADELAQRAFVRALQGLSQLRSEQEFGGWVVTIVGNLARNHLRDHGRFVPLPEEGDAAHEPTTAPDPDERLDAERRREQVRRAVAALPARQREVVSLRIDGELPFAEIGAALGITENAAKVSFHLGLKRLRERLGGAP